jgi:pimeloyl-ACP methyl ester carboxylesterase
MSDSNSSATRREVLVAAAIGSAAMVMSSALHAAISSARLCWDTPRVAEGGFFDSRGLQIPVAVSAFTDEIYQAPQNWASRAYAKLIHYNRSPKGGHFAAWEQPELFTAEMRASFRSLRA